ncbi:mediator of RNA polymerase II transcription subunit 10 isoform X2 [Symphalangus syndactylus]|uniref:mediator of RNA polymerase II transcription subunit 10 isoform X2 n=1 Tax=Symphalangus syndactylus TaxID=9590 RepID=UPI003004294C
MPSVRIFRLLGFLPEVHARPWLSRVEVPSSSSALSCSSPVPGGRSSVSATSLLGYQVANCGADIHPLLSWWTCPPPGTRSGPYGARIHKVLMSGSGDVTTDPVPQCSHSPLAAGLCCLQTPEAMVLGVAPASVFHSKSPDDCGVAKSHSRASKDTCVMSSGHHVTTQKGSDLRTFWISNFWIRDAQPVLTSSVKAPNRRSSF